MFRKRINLAIGAWLKKRGLFIDRLHRRPYSDLNLLALAVTALEKTQQDLQIIQIGAYDGVTRDPLFQVIENTSARVLFVEPQAEPMRKLKARYKNREGTQFEESAVSICDDEVSMFLEPNLKFSTKASLSRDHLSNFGHSSQNTTEIRVSGITVNSLIGKHQIGSVDLLQIDAEGYDFEIVKFFFEAEVAPKIINFESFHLNADDRNEMRKFFQDKGYRTHDHGLDTLAVRSSVYN